MGVSIKSNNIELHFNSPLPCPYTSSKRVTGTNMVVFSFSFTAQILPNTTTYQVVFVPNMV